MLKKQTLQERHKGSFSVGGAGWWWWWGGGGGHELVSNQLLISPVRLWTLQQCSLEIRFMRWMLKIKSKSVSGNGLSPLM